MASPSRGGGGGGGGKDRAKEKKGGDEALSGEGEGKAGTVGGVGEVLDVVDSAAVEAARAAAKAEAEAKAAEEAAVESKRAWKALLGTLGRENGLIEGSTAASALVGGGGVGGVGAVVPAAQLLQPAKPAPKLIHRGLVNTGNSCFRSVVLQALLACEPFVG